MIIESKGSLRLSRDQAKWVVRVRRAAPDLKPGQAWPISVSYWLREADGRETQHLDDFLAIAPWRSEEARDRYRSYLDDGTLPRIPGLDFIWDQAD